MPVIISTAESTDDEYVAQIISDVSWSYSDVVTVEIDLIPVPSAAAVRVEADLPAGGWVSLLEVRTCVPHERTSNPSY